MSSLVGTDNSTFPAKAVFRSGANLSGAAFAFYGTVGQGTVRLGSVWCGKVRHGWARQGKGGNAAIF